MAERLAEGLKLPLPEAPWHTHRDRIAEAASVLAIVAGTCGKIARDIQLMMQTDVAEAFEPSGEGRGGSSTMPHKRNPVAAATALAAATMAPNLAATIFAAQVQDHERSAGPWHAEWPTLPGLLLVTSGALAAVVDLAEGLEVDAARMRANLDATGGLIMAEAVTMALAGKIGKSAAHHLVEAASKQAVAGNQSLRDVLSRRSQGHRASRRRNDCRTVRADGLSGRLAGPDRPAARLARQPARHRRVPMPMIDADGCLLNVSVEGRDGGPTLMLSNSLGCNLQMWEPQMKALTQHFRVIRYDRRGHGKSGVPPAPYSMERFGRDVLAILDDLNIERVHWCGLSMGGMVGQWLGANAPQRFGKIILANTACHYPDPTNWLNRIKAVKQGGLASVADTVVAGWLTAEFREREPQITANLKAMLLASPAQGYLACCEALSTLDQRDLLPEIRSPTLVIAGRHDPATPVAAGEFIRGRIPGASMTILDAAHISNVEQPHAFTEAVIGFLTQR